MRDLFDLQNVVLVGSETLRQAVRSVVACEFCRAGAARVSFDHILEHVTGRSRAMAHYVMVECAAECPSCRRGLAETTLVEVAGEQPCWRELKMRIHFWNSGSLD